MHASRYASFPARSAKSMNTANQGLLHDHQKPDGDLDEYLYRGEVLDKFMNAIVMIVASALPTCSIVALYFIDSPLWRLIFVVLFSGVFASAVAFFTEARRVEVFTASLALAAVQVVFVGTAFGNGINGGGSGNGGGNG